MAGRLSGKRVLVIEEEYYIAADLQRLLDAEAGLFIGPLGQLEDGLVLAAEQLDAALLAFNLRGAPFAIAERLRAAKMPYTFTNYDSWATPEGYRAVSRPTEPLVMAGLIDAAERMAAVE